MCILFEHVSNLQQAFSLNAEMLNLSSTNHYIQNIYVICRPMWWMFLTKATFINPIIYQNVKSVFKMRINKIWESPDSLFKNGFGVNIFKVFHPFSYHMYVRIDVVQID